MIDEYVKESKVSGIIADHWKSLEHLKLIKKKYCLIHGKEINHTKGSMVLINVSLKFLITLKK